MREVSLSLVIPCYNESASLPLLIKKCRKLVDSTSSEVILVDNGSTDETPSVLSELLIRGDAIRSIRVEINQGYGYGILAGLREARGELLAWTHADLQTNPIDVAKGLEIFAKSRDPNGLFIKGRRYGRPLADIVFTIGMSIFETFLLRKILWDINAQPTMFSRKFFDNWHNPPYDFSLDLYAYYFAKKSKLLIKRFPVNFGERKHGMSHWNINWESKRKFILRTIDYSIRLSSRSSHQ